MQCLRFTASVLICVGLFGCDRSQQAQAPVRSARVRRCAGLQLPATAAAAAPAATTHRATSAITTHGSERESHADSESYGAESESSCSTGSDERRRISDGRRLRATQSAGEAHARG